MRRFISSELSACLSGAITDRARPDATTTSAPTVNNGLRGAIFDCDGVNLIIVKHMIYLSKLDLLGH
jgi:hypothetical protein